MPVIYPGAPIGSSSWTTGDLPTAHIGTTATTFYTLDINRDDETGSYTAADSNICTYTKQHNSSHLLINWWLPVYHATGGAGTGIRLRLSLDNSTYVADALDNGPAHGWGALGYGGNTAGTWGFTWDTACIDSFRSTSLYASHTGTVYFYFEVRSWSAEATYPITYSASYPKYGAIELMEYAV